MLRQINNCIKQNKWKYILDILARIRNYKYAGGDLDSEYKILGVCLKLKYPCLFSIQSNALKMSNYLLSENSNL